MTATFNTWLAFLLACCHRWNFGDTTLTYCSFEENWPRYRKNSAGYWKKRITTCTYIRWRSKWRRRPRRPFQNDKDFINSLCQKFPTLAQGMFDKEVLQFSDIEWWTLVPIYSCVYFWRFSGETIESWRHHFFQNWHSRGLLIKHWEVMTWSSKAW